jgi:large subunit ribosomal protein L31
VKKGIHPDYHPVVFVDHGASFEFTTRSTLKSAEKRTIDGVEHYVVRLDISSASHPFYTGKQKFVDTAGRIEKFQKKYAGKYGTKKAAAPAAEAPASATASAPSRTPAKS